MALAKTYSLGQLAADLRLDPRTLARQLAGLPADEEVSEGRRTTRRWYIYRVVAHLYRSERLDLTHERARLARAQAEARELANAVRRNELAPVDAVRTCLADVGSAIKTILESIPMRLKRGNPSLNQGDLDVVRREISRACVELAGIGGRLGQKGRRAG